MIGHKIKMCVLLVIVMLFLSGGASVLQAAAVAANETYTYSTVATGIYYSAAIRNDGTLWEWGNGISKPQINNSLSDVFSVAEGYEYKLALLKDGTVWAWGNNNSGELGIGTTTGTYQPVQVKGLSDITAVYSEFKTSAALKKDGTLWMWGENYGGLLGTGNTQDSRIPVQVRGIKDVVSFDISTNSCIAACKDGTVWVWGLNFYSDVTAKERLVPKKIEGLADIKQVSIGYYFNMALANDGTVYSWGSNGSGQLGLGTNNEGIFPTKIPNLTNVKKVLCHEGYAVALKNDGTVFSWGYRYEPAISSNRPVKISDVNDVIDISLSNHITAIRKDGSVWTMGFNNQGQLGDGSFISKDYFVQVFTQSYVPNIFVKILDKLVISYCNSTVTRQIYNTGYTTVSNQIYNLSSVTATAQISSSSIKSLQGKSVRYSVTADGQEISSGNQLITGEQYFSSQEKYFNVPVSFVVSGTKNYTIKAYVEGDSAQDVKSFMINVIGSTPTPTPTPQISLLKGSVANGSNRVTVSAKVTGSSQSVPVTISVIDPKGNLGYTSTIYSEPNGDLKMSYDISSLNYGTYTINASVGSNKASAKFDYYLYGDVFNDGIVDSADFSIMRRYLLEYIPNMPEPNYKITGDVNKDGVIDSADYSLMRRYLLDIISEFPAT
jgi:alpha-tubulin suppressor-like RCC1 family protein